MISPPPLRPDQRQDPYFEELVREGIAAVKAGDRKLARSALTKATMISLSDARPWLWLSATTDDPQEQRTYLERAVAADPSNADARRGLVMLSGKLDRSRLMPEGGNLAPRSATGLEEATGQAYMCPKCGGRLNFDVHKADLACPYCGYAQETEEDLAADDEESIDYLLPTTRGHRWAEAQRRLSCENCGSISLLPPGQKSDQCPYCGANRLVESAEDIELVDPQAIALMKLDVKDAAAAVKKWLAKGWLAPDDLATRAEHFQLRPAYYPFWTFDGTLEMPWACEVNEGSSKQPHWVTKYGAETEFFDDVLIPGIRVLSNQEVADIEPFALKALVVFKPAYLAGWTALTYDRALSDASLLGRERVIKRFRLQVMNNIEPGREKRNINISGGKWSGMTFKNILLPLWVGTYHYQGTDYHLLINGETGKVSGERPHDNLKMVLYIILGVLGVVTLIALLVWLWMTFGTGG